MILFYFPSPTLNLLKLSSIFLLISHIFRVKQLISINLKFSSHLIPLNNLGMYLGFPLSFSRFSSSSFQFLVDKISTRLLSWETKFLNIVGRVTLIKATLSFIPTHVTQVISIPISIINQINKLIRQYLWGSSTVKRKLSLVNWQTLTNPMLLNGLPNAKTRNFALLMNLAWRFYHSEAYWSTILHFKYPSHVPPSKYSPIYKSIQLGWSLCKPGLAFIFGNGHDIKFWTDVWCTLVPLASIFFCPFSPYDLQLLVSDVFQHHLWYLDLLSYPLTPDIERKIQSTYIPLNTSTATDKSIWNLTSNGSFSTSSAHRFLQTLFASPSTPLNNSYSWIWHSAKTFRKSNIFYGCVV